MNICAHPTCSIEIPNWRKYCSKSHANSVNSVGNTYAKGKGGRKTKNGPETIAKFVIRLKKMHADGVFNTPKVKAALQQNGRNLVDSNMEQGRPICKWFKIQDITCQGTAEAAYINSLVRSGELLPRRAKWVKTPLGYCAPDFIFDDPVNPYYVEVKSPWTYKKFLKEDDPQRKKMEWIVKNKMPIQIFVIGPNQFQIINL